MSTIGERIKSVRLRRGMTQAELSKRSGVSQSSIAHIEEGRVRHPAYLGEIAGALRCSVDELVTASPAPARKVRRAISKEEIELASENPLAAAERIIAISHAKRSSRIGK
jgi:XRE family transcriptional regulator of biofilm formation